MKEIHILVTGVGRRVELMQAFRQAALNLNINLKLYGADMAGTAPALVYCDYTRKVCSMHDKEYIQQLIDGILTSLKIMEVMMARKKKLSELAEGFTVYPQVLTNVRVTDKKAAQDDADVQAAVKKVTEELGDTGRILVRESGTEPVVRVMVEAESEEICQKYVDMVVNVIKENGYVAG